MYLERGGNGKGSGPAAAYSDYKWMRDGWREACGFEARRSCTFTAELRWSEEGNGGGGNGHWVLYVRAQRFWTFGFVNAEV